MRATSTSNETFVTSIHKRCACGRVAQSARPRRRLLLESNPVTLDEIPEGKSGKKIIRNIPSICDVSDKIKCELQRAIQPIRLRQFLQVPQKLPLRLAVQRRREVRARPRGAFEALFCCFRIINVIV